MLAAAVILAALAAADARAAAEAAMTCKAMKVDVRGDLDAHWVVAARELREEIAKLVADECTEATLTVLPDAGHALLRVETADGRMTERRVLGPSRLRSVALALIASIPRDAPRPMPPAAPPDRADSPPQAERPAKAAPPQLPSPVHASLGVSAGTRLGMPTRVVMAEVEGRADLFVHDWMVLAFARYAPLGARVSGTVPGYAYQELAVGLGFGRRVDIGSTSFDAAAILDVVLMTEEGDVPADGTGGDYAYARVGGSARWLFARLHGWRFGLTGDVELAPAAVRTPPTADRLLPSLPSWTSAARIVATGDLL